MLGINRERFKQVCRTFSCILFGIISSAQAFADSSYQYSLSASASHTDIESSGYGEEYSIGFAAYLSPVLFNSTLPYDLAAFYARIPALFLGAYDARNSSLNHVMGGRILDAYDSSSQYLTLRLADKNIPLWAELSYQHIDATKLQFRDGSTANLQPDKGLQLVAGWYPNDTFDIYALYGEPRNEVKVYGAGGRNLFKLKQNQFIKADFMYRITRTDTVTSEAVNAVMNQGPTKIDQAVWQASLSYFPNVKTRLGLTYSLIEDEFLPNGKELSASASYCLTKELCIGSSYLRHSQDSRFSVLSKYDSASAYLNYRF